MAKKGLDRLKTWLVSKLEEDNDFLLRVYFLSFISKKERLKVIQNYDDFLDLISNRYQKIDDTYQTVMGHYPYETLMYGKWMIQEEKNNK